MTQSSIVYHRPIWFRFLGITVLRPRKIGLCVRCMVRIPGKQSFITSLNIGRGGDCPHVITVPKGRYVWLAE